MGDGGMTKIHCFFASYFFCQFVWLFHVSRVSEEKKRYRK